MVLELQFKIRNNPNYQRYLRENSYWYKILNRDPGQFDTFDDQVKDAYQLRTSDKISKTLDTLEILQAVMSSFK